MNSAKLAVGIDGSVVKVVKETNFPIFFVFLLRVRIHTPKRDKVFILLFIELSGSEITGTVTVNASGRNGIH